MMARRRMTARMRLTTFYTVLFLAGGLLLIGLILTVVFASGPGVPDRGAGNDSGVSGEVRDRLRTEARDELRTRLLVACGIALPVLTVIALGAGWVMAGRVLRPVRSVSATARRLSERDLHERLPVDKPHDELTDLAATFNDMLARLERAFTAQQLFTANASHELRGPITTQRALVDVTLATPGITQDTRELASTLQDLLRRQERLLNGLFELASGQYGAQRHEPVALHMVARVVLDRWRNEAGSLRIVEQLAPATIDGDPVLVEILFDNLVRNAITHNVADGWLRVRTGNADQTAVIVVENSGPTVSPERLAELTAPFRRGHRDRASHAPGAGLGLTIVDTVAKAHNGQLRLVARDAGGVLATISFR